MLGIEETMTPSPNSNAMLYSTELKLTQQSIRNVCPDVWSQRHWMKSTNLSHTTGISVREILCITNWLIGLNPLTLLTLMRLITKLAEERRSFKKVLHSTKPLTDWVRVVEMWVSVANDLLIRIDFSDSCRTRRTLLYKRYWMKRNRGDTRCEKMSNQERNILQKSHHSHRKWRQLLNLSDHLHQNKNTQKRIAKMCHRLVTNLMNPLSCSLRMSHLKKSNQTSKTLVCLRKSLSLDRTYCLKH